MKIVITEHHLANGNAFYRWELWDGPADLSDHAEGQAASVHQALVQIGAARRRISGEHNWTPSGR